MTTILPLIRLSAVNPFLAELERRGLGAAALLHEFGLPPQIPASHELFVAPGAIYELIERSAEIANDRYLGFSIGSMLDLQGWDPISVAAEKANTVGELLTLFAMQAAEHSTATKFYVNTDGRRTTFGLERIKKPPLTPGQNDAFYMGFMLRLLMHAAREHWDASDVMFTVADPACIPPTSEPYRIAAGDVYGVRITFPSRWLFEAFEKSHFHTASKTEQGHIPVSLIDSVRSALKPHLHETDLTVDKAARICGFNRRRLSRELRDEGTTLSKEIARLRARKAGRALSESDRRVAEIAQSVGFTDPTVFSRAFKNWTGQSPQNYRRSHRSPMQGD